MVSKKVDTQLARTREMGKLLGKLALDINTSVEPSLMGLVNSVRRVVATELAFVEKGQAAGTPMDTQESKKLQNLMAALAASVTVEKAAKEAQQLDAIPDEELDALLKDSQA